MKLKTDTIWMIITGATGFTFFLIANFSTLFRGANQLAAVIQLVINFFVLVVYSRAISDSTGLKKLIAILGTVIPIGMATITILQVFLGIRLF